MLKTVTAALLAFTAISSTASAATIEEANGSTGEKIFSIGDQSGNTIFGVTKDTGTSVTFYSSTSEIGVNGKGYAQIYDATEGSPWTDLQVSLTTNPFGFTGYEFTIQFKETGGKKKDAVPSVLTVGYQLLGSSTIQSFAPPPFTNSASKDFLITAGQGEIFSKLYFSTNNPISQIKQNDITLAPTSAVPEPHSWAMMIAGFGLVGVSLRRSRRTSTTATLA